MALKDWIRLTDNAWINTKNDLRLAVDYVEYVRDNLHFVVDVKSPDYMHMNIELEKSFKTKSEALKFAKDYRKNH